MVIEPATVNQIMAARDGRFVEITADVGGVAADLRRIDPNLRVRFAENGNPPFWAVYHQSDDNRTTYLVLTARAFQMHSGAWGGLDQRIVKRVEQIGHSSYDYAAEVERGQREVRDANRQRFRDKVAEHAEVAAHGVRRELGLRKNGRAFVPKGLQ